MKKILLYGNGFDIELGRRFGLSEETELRQIVKNKIFAIPRNIDRVINAKISKLPGQEHFFENYFRTGEQFEKEVELFINNFELNNEILKEDVAKKRKIVKDSIITFKNKRKKAYIQRCEELIQPVFRNLDLLINRKIYMDHDEKLLISLSVEERIKYAKDKLSDKNMEEQIYLIQNITHILSLYNNYLTLLTTNYFGIDEIIISILRIFVNIGRFIGGDNFRSHRMFRAFNSSWNFRSDEVQEEFKEIISFLEKYEEGFLVFNKMKYLFIEWAKYKGPGKINKTYKVNSFTSMMGSVDYMDYVYSSNTKDRIFRNGADVNINTLEEDWLNNISNISKELSDAEGSANITIFGFSPINDIFLMNMFNDLMDEDSNVTFIKYERDSKRGWYRKQMKSVKDIFGDRLESCVGKIEDIVK